MPTGSCGKIPSGARQMESPLLLLQRNIKQFDSPFVHKAQIIKDISISIYISIYISNQSREQNWHTDHGPDYNHHSLTVYFYQAMTQIKHGIYLDFSYNTKTNPCLYLIQTKSWIKGHMLDIWHLGCRPENSLPGILRYTSLHWYAFKTFRWMPQYRNQLWTRLHGKRAAVKAKCTSAVSTQQKPAHGLHIFVAGISGRTVGGSSTALFLMENVKEDVGGWMLG